MQETRIATTLSEGDFENSFVASIDESITGVLGERVTQAVYDALEKNFSIRREEVPHRVNDFALGLEKAFGIAPSETISRVIVKRLYSKLGLAFVEAAGWRLPDYVREARRRTGIGEVVE